MVTKIGDRNRKNQRDRLRGTVLGDVLQGLGGNDSLFGLKGGDRLEGGLGNDLLDGGLGNDTLIGGKGNDTYIVSDANDIVVERLNGGIDTIRSGISFRLPNRVENGILVGTAALNAQGNALNNTITGNSGNNGLTGAGGNDIIRGLGGSDTLDGGAGIDQLNGGLGDDTYFVDHINDRIIEAANQGVDVISTQVNYSLANAPQVENLLLAGIALSGTGNALSNIIAGNGLDNTISGGDGDDRLLGDDGADILLGEAGNDLLAGQADGDRLEGGSGDDVLVGSTGTDTLIGGAGADVFLFDLGAAFSTAEVAGNDVITDFEFFDTIALDNDTFTALTSIVGRGFNVGSEFAVVANDASVSTSNARIIYSQGSGSLFYNTGQLGVPAQLFATLSTKPILVAANFAIIE